MVILPLNLNAQGTKEYYVVVKENMSIDPTQKTTLSDGSLSLNFDNQELNTFFNNKTVYKFDIAFKGANSDLLKRTYIVSISESDTTDFNILSKIDFVEKVPISSPLEYPNDFDLEIPSFATNPLDVESYQLIWLTPNPAASFVTVSYSIENATSAYLIVTDQTNGVSSNYMLSSNSASVQIDLNNYTPGNYIVTLVCNGQIVESKHLIKN